MSRGRIASSPAHHNRGSEETPPALTHFYSTLNFVHRAFVAADQEFYIW
jgi:hypothetical protein